MTNLILSISNAAEKPAVGMLVVIGIVFLIVCVAVGYLALWFYRAFERIKNKPDNEI